MVQIVLIQPGATEYHRQGRIQGTLDVPLNAEGTAEVARVGEELKDRKLSAVYCSSGEACRQTAAALGECLGVKVKELDNMQNLNHGLWQGMLIDDFKRKQPKVYRQWQDQPDTIRPPEGEMLDEARRRIQVAMKKLLKKHKEGMIGLIVPEPLASLVKSYLNHTQPGDLWQAGFEHGKWETLDVEPATLVQNA